MSPERPSGSNSSKPYEISGFTEHEISTWRVNQERFTEIIGDDRTLIYEIRETSNNYGEFLFITTSRPGSQGHVAMTFYGPGYHDYRDRWLDDEWFWYQSSLLPESCSELSKK